MKIYLAYQLLLVNLLNIDVGLISRHVKFVYHRVIMNLLIAELRGCMGRFSIFDGHGWTGLGALGEGDANGLEQAAWGAYRESEVVFIAALYMDLGGEGAP